MTPPLQPPLSPQRYEASLDPVEDDEAQTAQDIAETMLRIAGKTFADGGHAIRSVHAKSHGLLKAELEVLADLPAVLAQGLFARPGRYPTLMRFSTIPGDILDDKVSTPRGLALKVLGVEGERLEGAEGASTQDFVMVNGPRFNSKTGKAFLRGLKLVAATTDKAEGAKEALSAVLRGTEKLVEAFGGKSGTLRSLGGEPPTHVLGETYFAQLPLRHGEHIAKYQLVPVSAELTALTGQLVDLHDTGNALREALVEHFRSHGGRWELRAQLCTNVYDMPLDDPTAEWSEEESPYLTVAVVTAPPQTGWSAARSAAVDDGMGFSPWHGLQAHRPLGAIMRLRKLAYATSQRFRSQRNAIAVQEPDKLDALDD
ncbi:catalase [Pseudoxanthomonas gei]|uniref:Catalase n=1 Tax=Pseudoxanthomonas gei TaxID=1383030 RepID=A0ABX0AD79_9GAMM|nr:catalase family protein [Pseudoxanthomonas gei]NDK38470.1 catalase [Pseudoxanthomonas gei]